MNYNYNCLKEFYKANKIRVTEGFLQKEPRQVSKLIEICNYKRPKNILEIGFNGGYISEIFLENSNANVYSFDIGDHLHQYLKYGKEFINTKYPNRHTLIFGDSRKTVPTFIKNNQHIKFDIIFINGNHDYPIVYTDIFNCKALAHKTTVLVVNDVMDYELFEESHTIGPTKAWKEFIRTKKIKQLEVHEWSKGRGMVLGYYDLDK